MDEPSQSIERILARLATVVHTVKQHFFSYPDKKDPRRSAGLFALFWLVFS